MHTISKRTFSVDDSKKTNDSNTATKPKKAKQRKQANGHREGRSEVLDDANWRILTDNTRVDNTNGSSSAKCDTSMTSFHEMEKAFNYWIIQGDIESTNRCFHLLDEAISILRSRCANSTNAQGHGFTGHKGTIILNRIVNNWRMLIKDQQKLQQQHAETRMRQSSDRSSRRRGLSLPRHRDGERPHLLLPSEVLERIDQYKRELWFRPNIQTYSMIMDVSTYFGDDPKEGVSFSDDLLNRLIDEYNNMLLVEGAASPEAPKAASGGEQVLIIQPDIISFGSVIHGWSRSQRRDAPEHAYEWLNRIKALRNQHDSWENGLQLTAVLYTSIIMAYTRVGDAERAEQILEELLLASEGKTSAEAALLKPDIFTFNAVMSAWSRNAASDNYSRSSSLSAQKRQKRPRQQQRRERNSKIATDYHAAERVQSLLSRMTKLHNIGYLDDGPNLVSYNILIDCWSKLAASTSPIGSRLNHHRKQSSKQRIQEYGLPPEQRAEDILRYLQNHSDPKLQPNNRSYNMVIAAYARVGNVDKAEAVLQEMLTEYQAGGINVKPDVRSFTSLLSSYSHLAQNIASRERSVLISNPSQRMQTVIDIAERAETVLRHMQQLHKSGRFDVKPNVQSYSSVIGCWAQASSPLKKGAIKRQVLNDNRDEERRPDTEYFAAERAEALLREMQQQDDPSVSPDERTYANVMNAWARAGKPGRASALLEELLMTPSDDMEGTLAALRPNTKVKPNAHMFTTVLSAWAKCATPNAADRAQGVLSRMQQLYESGQFPHCKPNVVSYTALINCWANAASATKQDAAEHAQAILESMKQSDDPKVQPNSMTYSAIIRAHSNADQPEMAERCLYEMLDEFRTHGKYEVQPDVYTFGLVLTAWSKSTAAEAPERAERLLAEMQGLYETGIISSRPNVYCFGSVLSCWKKSKLNGAADRAESILRSMQQNGDVQPNLVLYNTVIDAYSNLAVTTTNSTGSEIDSKEETNGSKDEQINRSVQRAVALFDELLEIAEGRKDDGNWGVQTRSKDSSKRHEFLPDKYTYHSVVRAINCVRDTRRSQTMMDKVLKTMARYKVTPNSPTLKLLGNIHTKGTKSRDLPRTPADT